MAGVFSISASPFTFLLNICFDQLDSAYCGDVRLSFVVFVASVQCLWLDSGILIVSSTYNLPSEN